MRRSVGLVLGAALVALTASSVHVAAASVLCQKRRGGGVVVRDPTCKSKETQLNLVDFGAVGPIGPPGPTGPTDPSGPTAASFGVRNPASIATTLAATTVVSLTDPEATGGGVITVAEDSHLQITAAIEMHHSGGTADLPLGISCQPFIQTASGVSEAGPPTRMEVFGQSNHNAYVTMPVVADALVPPGTYDVRIDCKNGFPEDSFPGVRRIDSATLNVIAVRR